MWCVALTASLINQIEAFVTSYCLSDKLLLLVLSKPKLFFCLWPTCKLDLQPNSKKDVVIKVTLCRIWLFVHFLTPAACECNITKVKTNNNKNKIAKSVCL